jgi:hypothetical protein
MFLTNNRMDLLLLEIIKIFIIFLLHRITMNELFNFYLKILTSNLY